MFKIILFGISEFSLLITNKDCLNLNTHFKCVIVHNDTTHLCFGVL